MSHANHSAPAPLRYAVMAALAALAMVLATFVPDLTVRGIAPASAAGHKIVHTVVRTKVHHAIVRHAVHKSATVRTPLRHATSSKTALFMAIMARSLRAKARVGQHPLAATAVITPTPAAGVPLQTVLVSGSGFTSTTPITIEFVQTSATVVATATSTMSGTFVATTTVPSSAVPGQALLIALDTSGDYAPASFTVLTPTIALSPNPALPGSAVSTAGSGFGAGETVTVTENTVALTTTTTPTGTFTLGLTAPITPGSYPITATGSLGAADQAAAVLIVALQATATPTATIVPTATPTATATAVQSVTPSATPTAIPPTVTPTVTPTANGTASPTPTSTAIAAPTQTPGPCKVGRQGDEDEGNGCGCGAGKGDDHQKHHGDGDCDNEGHHHGDNDGNGHHGNRDDQGDQKGQGDQGGQQGND